MPEKKRLMYINRQPTLWRHGAPAVLITPQDDDDDETIGLNPLFLEPLNADFDGDTVALYGIHDEEALDEMEQKAYIKNYVNYDTNRDFLSIVRHEALYAAFVMTEVLIPIKSIDPIELNSLDELEEDIEWYNNKLRHPIKINNTLYTYGVCLFNKWCGFKNILINKVITKQYANLVSSKIYKHVDLNTGSFYNRLHKLDNFLFMFITMTKHCPSINVTEMADLVDEDIRALFKKLPKNNVTVGYNVNEALIEKCIENFNTNHQLYKLFKSGSRFSKTQLARSCINIGYTADANNIIVPEPIKGNLLTGISEEEFFLGAPGTRKSIRDKSKFTPDSGYLERTLVMALSILEISEEDCGGTNYLEIPVFDEKHSETLVGKYFKDPNQPYNDWEILDWTTALKFIDKTILIRSPMTCTTPNFKMCQKCFGERQFETKYLGIVCGQTISERLTQLVLRTFHTSGAAELEIDQVNVKFIKEHLIDIKNDNISCTLIFNTPDIPPELTGLKSFDTIIEGDNVWKARFKAVLTPTPNNDTILMLKQIQMLLKTIKNPRRRPVEFYQQLMKLVLSVGTPYSSFVEMVFANMFMTDKKKKEFWRYYPHRKIRMKLGDKVLAKHLSNLLGLLYQPNQKTISDMEKLEDIDIENTDLTIYEKIFLSRL